jgi:hypothetical protein
VYAAKPVGYPKTSSICGRVGCEEVGLVFLTQSEYSDFRVRNRRIFRYGTHTTQVKVSDVYPVLIEDLYKKKRKFHPVVTDVTYKNTSKKAR